MGGNGYLVRTGKYICGKCYDGKCPYRDGKALCPKMATSVICETKLLDENSRVKIVATNGVNRYYHVRKSNTVIFNVENMYCILIDYKVKSAVGGNKKICLPIALSACRYTMQNCHGRDWCRNGKCTIGEVIHRLVNGNLMIDLAKQNGYQEDHRTETFNEKICNTQYGPNPVEASHQVRVEIKTQKELNEFLDDLIAAEKAKNGVYYDKIKKARVKRNRQFVHFK